LVIWIVRPWTQGLATNVSEEHTASIFKAEHMHLAASPNGVRNQKINMDIFTAM
jgi:hypothetical protein